MNTPRNVRVDPAAAARLSSAIDDRLRELGMSLADAVREAGGAITTQTFRALRRGENWPTAKTARAVDRALRWQWHPSSTLAILQGGDPVPLPPPDEQEDADIARIQAMEHLSDDAKAVIIARIEQARRERHEALRQAEELNQKRNKLA